MKFTLEVMLFEKHKNHKNKKHTRPHPPKADKCEMMDKQPASLKKIMQLSSNLRMNCVHLL